MDENSAIAANMVRAIEAAMDWRSTPNVRKEAVAYLESIKSGDIKILASTSFVLVKKELSSEVRLHGFKMLQHLVRLRWDEFSDMERRSFAIGAVNLLSEIVDPHEEWALKSQAAALVAEVVRREGLNLWQELLPLIGSISDRGPVEAELIAMMLRWLPEDITVHNEDLEGDRRRELLRGLTQSLPEILPLLYNLLERHFGAALNAVRQQQFDLAKRHAAAVTATLNAINAYAEWAPVSDLARYGLIQGCGILLSSLEFRHDACMFFRFLSQRRRPIDDTATDFDSAMNGVFHILINVSRDFLSSFSTNAAGIDDSELEFVECLCESMVSMGSFCLQYDAKEDTLLSVYLQQMLGYFQHFKLAIHIKSLPFWLSLMREITSKPKNASQTAEDSLSGSGHTYNEKKALGVLINDDICCSILDVSFQRMLRKPATPGSALPSGTLELWSDDFDGKSDFSQHRSRLLELIRLVASFKPMVAVTKVSQRIESIMNAYSQDAIIAQALDLLESMHLGLETVVGAVFDGPAELVCSAPEIKFGIHEILEGLLKRLLSLKWEEPTLAVMLGRFLDAYGLFLKCYPDSVGGVINKLFELLTSLPYVLKDPVANSARHARLQICASFIRIAKAADKSLLPHMRGIADTMAYLEAEGHLFRGERNLLSEAFLVMASSAGIQQQQEVLAWLLEPLSRQWTQSEWQNAYLSDPLGLVRLCSDSQFMWSIFHTVTFFEKALKRSGLKKNNPSSAVENTTSPLLNPMSSHLSWMLPPLLKLLRCIHSLWSHQIAHALPVELRGAMSMSHVEQASLLGEGVSKISKVQFPDGSQTEMSTGGHAESNENDLRNWLKGIRDSGYNVLGLSATVDDTFFRCSNSTDVALALMENIQSMEFRHIRQLVHLAIIPLVKFCPSDLWENWLENILHPLFLHSHQALSCSWSSLLREGRASVPDIFGNLSGLDLKVEVMEEKLLRGLTREICQLLSILASSNLNSGVPSLDQLGNSQRIESSSLKDLNAFASNSITCFLLLHKRMALPALQITLEAFTWTDGEAACKVASFCGILVLLAISTNNVELRQFVAKDMFYAIIQSLTLESNAIISAEFVGLCRDIFVYLSDRDPSPRQVLMSLPGISADELLAFEDALGKTSSPKERRQLLKSLLLLAKGINFKALAAQRSPNVITNVSTKPRGASSLPVPSVEDDEPVGLAAIT